MEQLQTDRLILRQWSPGDAPDLFRYASGAKTGPMAGWAPHKSLSESRGLISVFIKQNETWAIVLKDTGRVIGSVGLHRSRKTCLSYELELGYSLSEDYWGRGIMPEAVKKVIWYAFERANVQKLIVSHFPFNTQSKSVILKCGFKPYKLLKNSWLRYDGAVLDEEVYYMDKKLYLELQNKQAIVPENIKR